VDVTIRKMFHTAGTGRTTLICHYEYFVIKHTSKNVFYWVTSKFQSGLTSSNLIRTDSIAIRGNPTRFMHV